MLDLKGGRAVHAVAGDRAAYRPLRSRFAPTADPVALARGLRDQAGATELYLADLDAITDRAEPAWSTLRAVADLGLAAWADVGVRDGAGVDALIRAGVATLVIGLESIRGPEVLARAVDRAGAGRVVWSLDLRAGVPIVRPDHDWRGDPADPASLIDQAVAAGVRRILRLDLATVGPGRGVDQTPPAPTRWPGVEWATGGGVAAPADLATLDRLGYSAVLVGSAVHDGRVALGQGSWSSRP